MPITEFLKIALPVILNYLGLMTMGIVDLIFVGRVSAEGVAAVGIGNSAFSWAMVTGLGFITPLEYFISKSYGAGNRSAMRQYLIQVLLLSAVLGVLLMVVLQLASSHFGSLGVREELAFGASEFIHVIQWSLLPVFFYNTLRQYLQGQGKVVGAAWVMVIANVMNVVLCSWLVKSSTSIQLESNGLIDFLGVQNEISGVAWATLLGRWWMFLAMLTLFWVHEKNLVEKNHQEKWLRGDWVFKWITFKEVFRVGAPASAQMLLEVGVFAVVTFLAGRLATESVAAHQIVLSLAGLMFMVPLGVGSATAVLVGQEVGRQNFQKARNVGWQGIRLATGFMAFSSFLLWFLGEAALSIYTQDPGVIRLGVSILLIAAFFQIFDGAQAITTGALRGLGETRWPAAANLIGHWGIGLPVGYWLCFTKSWNVQGLWIGLSLGLIAVALILVYRWEKLSQRKVSVSML